MCIDFRRAVTSMAIIGLCVAIAANVFTIYAIRLPRYVLRRLAGCLQLGAGQICNSVTVFIVTFVTNKLITTCFIITDLLKQVKVV